jgi:hypothetical protein
MGHARRFGMPATPWAYRVTLKAVKNRPKSAMFDSIEITKDAL